MYHTCDVYDTIFNTNVRSVFWSRMQEAKAMPGQGTGSIINNASMGGVIGFAKAALYVASKHTITALTKTASIEWFRQGIRVNAIRPGLIDTPFQDRTWPSEQAKADFGAASVPGRMGTPEETAAGAAFLASDEASFVFGHGRSPRRCRLFDRLTRRGTAAARTRSDAGSRRTDGRTLGRHALSPIGQGPNGANIPGPGNRGMPVDPERTDR